MGTYKEDYKKDVEGKGRSDPANAFTEHAHLRRVSADISSTDYGKTAKKIMNECKGIPEDAAIFKIAKENAANLSDINYKKDLPATQEAMKGYQTMDPATHPVVVEKKKKLDLFSDKVYHQEWEDEKFMVYFPEHITEGYESKAALAKA